MLENNLVILSQKKFKFSIFANLKKYSVGHFWSNTNSKPWWDYNSPSDENSILLNTFRRLCRLAQSSLDSNPLSFTYFLIFSPVFFSFCIFQSTILFRLVPKYWYELMRKETAKKLVKSCSFLPKRKFESFTKHTLVPYHSTAKCFFGYWGLLDNSTWLAIRSSTTEFPTRKNSCIFDFFVLFWHPAFKLMTLTQWDWNLIVMRRIPATFTTQKDDIFLE